MRDQLQLDLFAAGRESAGIAVTVARDEIPSVFARAVGGGGTPVQEPHEQPWGQIVGYVRDPDGHLLEICSPVG